MWAQPKSEGVPQASPQFTPGVWLQPKPSPSAGGSFSFFPSNCFPLSVCKPSREAGAATLRDQSLSGPKRPPRRLLPWELGSCSPFNWQIPSVRSHWARLAKRPRAGEGRGRGALATSSLSKEPEECPGGGGSSGGADPGSVRGSPRSLRDPPIKIPQANPASATVIT